MNRIGAAILLTFLSLASLPAAHAKTFVVVLPASYPGPREALAREFADFVGAMTPADRLFVYDASGPSTITTIRIPDDPRSESPAWRRKKLAEQAAPLVRHLQTMRATGSAGTVPGNLMIPSVVDEIARNVIPSVPDKAIELLLIGSWFHSDPRDGRFAMSDRFFPSDGHIAASAADTPFGLAGKGSRLTGSGLHFCWPQGQTEFATHEHEEAVRRWWTLWTQAQGGRVGGLSFDLPTCFRLFRNGTGGASPEYRIAKESKVEMRRARPPIAPALPASFERPGEYFLRDDAPISRTPPPTSRGLAWVGLRWDANCDIDLYARSDASQPWLFFGNVRSADGLFNKDFLVGTGSRQFEFVEMNREIDLGKAEVAINLFAGELPAPPEGVIRVWFGGQVYEAPFKLAATRGNHGGLPMAGAHWLKIDLRKVVGLPAS